MKQRLLAGVVSALLVFGYGCARQEPLYKREPLYKGKPAGYWIAALKNQDPQVRQQAVDALEHLATASPEAIPALIDFLGTGAEKRQECKSVYVRVPPESAVKALTRIGRPAQPALVEALRHKDPVVRAGAAAALRDTGDDGMAALIRALGAVGAAQALADSKQGIFGHRAD
jgi:HEAT repeat protein